MNEIVFLKFIDSKLEELKASILLGDNKFSLIEIIEDIRKGIRWQLEEEDRA